MGNSGDSVDSGGARAIVSGNKYWEKKNMPRERHEMEWKKIENMQWHSR